MLMVILDILKFSFPLKNPVLLFSLILFIILFAPLLLNKFKIPHLIGLIIAGAIIGPHGLNLMLRDSSIILFGTVGLLYIMFLAGIEIDIANFKKNSGKSIVFGMYTFAVPMILGYIAAKYLLFFSVQASILLASMFASHTLIAYPIISRLGVAKNRAVNITVGGTMITDTLALLVLAVIAEMAKGEITQGFWLKLIISIIIFSIIVSLGFPMLGRWFFKRFDDNISQYIFVLGLVFMGAFLAEAAGIEPIIGAFLAGLALNRLVPQTSPLMNRIEFVGNALFIPFFLIGVGMLVDFRAFVKDLETIKVAIIMTVIASVSKFVAAWFTQKTFKFSVDERRIIFGLSNAQAAATLAAILVAYNIIIGKTPSGEPIRLLNESVLNGTILMILVTCTIASFVAQKGAQNIALLNTPDPEADKDENEERILIPVSSIELAEELVNLSTTVKSKNSDLYALTVIPNESENDDSEKKAQKILEKAVNTAASTDNKLHDLIRYDLNIVNGITGVVREHKITDIILGLHQKKGISDSFLGHLTEGILTKCNTTTLIYKPAQPLSTIKRHLVILPERAEREIGFPFWLIKVWNIATNTGAKLVFYAPRQTLSYIRSIHAKHPVEAEFNIFNDFNEFLILSRDIKSDDNLIVVMSRKNHASYHNIMPNIPVYLNKYFQLTNFIMIYPMQQGVSGDSQINLKDPSLLEPFKDNLDRLDKAGKVITRLFRKK
jgi:Kef-type K+ transport system membrane component KefB/nucleotide-binding universal stress UspA family protein